MSNEFCNNDGCPNYNHGMRNKCTMVDDICSCGIFLNFQDKTNLSTTKPIPDADFVTKKELEEYYSVLNEETRALMDRTKSLVNITSSNTKCLQRLEKFKTHSYQTITNLSDKVKHLLEKFEMSDSGTILALGRQDKRITELETSNSLMTEKICDLEKMVSAFSTIDKSYQIDIERQSEKIKKIESFVKDKIKDLENIVKDGEAFDELRKEIDSTYSNLNKNHNHNIDVLAERIYKLQKESEKEGPKGGPHWWGNSPTNTFIPTEAVEKIQKEVANDIIEKLHEHTNSGISGLCSIDKAIEYAFKKYKLEDK